MKANIVEVQQIDNLDEGEICPPYIIEEDGFLRFSWLADVRWLNFTGHKRETKICWKLSVRGAIVGDEG